MVILLAVRLGKQQLLIGLAQSPDCVAVGLPLTANLEFFPVLHRTLLT
jgi:hypothetical protein